MRTDFQKDPTQLIRQQEILAALGFYKGKVDGIWGPSSTAAMKQFEADPTFLPGIPNHGMPLSDTGPHPAGIYKDAEVKRSMPVMLLHPLLIKPAAAVVPIAAPVQLDSPSVKEPYVPLVKEPVKDK